MGDRRKKDIRRQPDAPPARRADPLPPPGVRTEIIEERIELRWRYHLPPPSLLKEYSFIADGPERLLRMAEENAKARRAIQNRDSRTESFQRVFGPISALILGLAGLGIGAVLIWNDHSVTGLIALLGTLGTLIGTMLGARKRSEPTAPREEQTDLFSPESRSAPHPGS